MKFDRLQASISNNANESPSLYMAFCAVESLFADLEDNCGSDISFCPVGDERLPSKLVWLCRIINEIYRDNSNELQRNRSRLDAAMEKLNETQKELEKSSFAFEQLENMQAEYAALEQQLQNNNAAATEYEKLSAKCLQAKQTLEQLGTFDFSAAEEELKQLNAEITLKENAIDKLQAEIEQTRESANSLQQEVDGLQAQKQELSNQLLTLQSQQESTDDEKSQLSKELNLLKSELTDCGEEYQQLIAKRDEALKNIEILKGKIVEFREDNLAAKYAELEAVKEESEQLEDELNAFDSDCNRIKEQRNQLLIDIAHKKTENESLHEKLTLSQQKHSELEKEKLCLSAELSDCVQKLEELQSEVDDLTRNKLPDVRELQTQEQLRKAELQQNVNDAENQLIVLRDEITKLNDCLPKLEEDVKNNRAIYDALTASCAVNSVELENLERQIEELRNNTDEQKLVVYRKQLEEKQQELEKIQLECKQTEQEAQEQQTKLEQLQKEKDRLNGIKQRREEGVIATEKMLLELKFVADEKYIQEVVELDERHKLLEKTSKNLADSLNNMQKILGKTPLQQNVSLEDQLVYNLRDLRSSTEELRCSLVECARRLKLEER